MTTRRDFIKSSLLAGVGASMVSNFAFATNNVNAAKKIGIQLWTLKDEVKNDFKGTLKKIAEVGYKEFEFAGYHNNDPKDIKKFLDSIGVKAPSAHIPTTAFEEDINKVIADAKTIGHKYLTVPWMAPKTMDDYKKAADNFNKWGKAVKDAGMQFCYHNHDFEFKEIDGQVPYDYLLNNTDKNLVTYELDLYWVKRAGKDILTYFEKYPGRFEMWHVKDMDKNNPAENTEVGTGQLDFKTIFSKAKQSGMKHFFVEHEGTFKLDKFESITKSYNYLKSIV
ncbi:MAG TPA: sugar phosphate isomerase/epimerase [Cytophagales bacterium]|nr:sugar phosphate isomerase/epimerase [Cytophagales bacterium]